MFPPPQQILAVAIRVIFAPLSLIALLLFTLLVSPAHATPTSSIGVILPLVGDFARYGERLRRGVESGSDKGTHFIFEDDGCLPKKAVEAFYKLRRVDGVKLFLGPWCGSPQVAVAPLLHRTGGLAILGSSAPERVYSLSGGHMLAVQPSIEAESLFNARELFRLGGRRVAIVFFENDFSRAHEAVFRREFKGKVVDTLVYSANDGSALRSIATVIKRLKVDTVYLPDASPLLHGFVRQLYNQGVHRLRLLSVYSAQSSEVAKEVGQLGDGLILSYPNISEDAVEFYPRKAADVLSYGQSQCPDSEVACIRDAILKKYPFNERGVLPGELRLKELRNGVFSWLESVQQVASDGKK